MSKFWGSFDKMFDNLSEMLTDLQGPNADSTVKQTSVGTHTTAEILVAGHKINIETIGNKFIIKVDGREYVKKNDAKNRKA